MSLLRRPRASDATPQPSPADPGAKYRSIVENAVAGMFQTSPDGRYLTANPALARIYGYESTAALTDAITDIAGQLYVDPHRRAEFRRLLQSSDVVEGFESETYRRDGSVIWISESARAVRTRNSWRTTPLLMRWNRADSMRSAVKALTTRAPMSASVERL